METAGLVERIRVALADAGDPQRAADQQRYMKSSMPFRGIRVPEVRRLVQDEVTACGAPLERDAMQLVAGTLWDEAEYREERYAAIAVCRHQAHRDHLDPQSLGLSRHFIETGAWWDLVDETAHLVGEVLKRHPEVATIMREWAQAPNLWVRRVAIISQLGRGATTDQQLLADVIAPNLADGDFFIRKAIGWALRQYARTDPEWVRTYVATHPLSALSRREAMKHLA